MASVVLFVYGSLRRGELHHDELAGAAFLGAARAAPGYALTELGGYRALVEEPGTGVVDGELFEVSETHLPALDAFEGPAYVRGKVRLTAAHSLGFSDALAYLRKSR